jgi:DNA recombination protein RmuC
MSDTVIVVIVCLFAGLAAGTLIAWLLRPRAEPDRAADQGLVNLNARLDAMGSWLQNAHGKLEHSVNTRLDAVTARVGESMQASTNTTAEHLQNLHVRLAVIDSAQKNITDLATTVSSLQKVFDNKQRRGAFGQGRMEAIISDGLPKGAYEFQLTLSNGSRPDCCIMMPDKRPLVIDSKFPLEAVIAIERATTDDERVDAGRQLRQNLTTHINDIAKKYFIPGETQDLAFMFIPSESVYAELYDGFDDIFQKAYRARVMIVSPSLLMLAVQVVQQIQKDARMREAADKIHAEVGHLMDDLDRLRDRVDKLGKHFSDANEDVRQILISAQKVEKHGEHIRNVEFGEDQPSAEILPGPGARKLGAGE